MNSLQSAGDGSVDLSRAPSLRGEPPGLRPGLDEGVRGSLYRDLQTQGDRTQNTRGYRGKGMMIFVGCPACRRSYRRWMILGSCSTSPR